jgi:hypothetical protein
VTVTRRHHPLEGQQFDVLMEGKQRLTLRINDGSTMRIPRQWTDADGVDTDQPPVREGIYTTESLRRLFSLIDAFKDR